MNDRQIQKATASLVRPKTVADEIGVARQTVYKWIKNEGLEVFDIDGISFTTMSAVKKFLKRRTLTVTDKYINLLHGKNY